MSRINVYSYPDTDDFAAIQDGPVLEGWFDPDKATAIRENTEWDGNNHRSVHTGSQWDHELLYRTAKGRWVLNRWSNRQGSTETYEFLTDEDARQWLIKNNSDDEVATYFSALDEESGPNLGGRPEIGPAIQIRLPADRIVAVDKVAADQGVSRAEMIRRLVDTGLAGQGRQPHRLS